MADPVKGRRLVCGESGKVVKWFRSVRDWQFWDYSWPCKGCGGRHCSECFYETDGETITVYECGNWR